MNSKQLNGNKLELRNQNKLFFELEFWSRRVWDFFRNRRLPDEQYIQRIFFKAHGYEMDFQNPQSLNQKLQWIKLNDRRNIFVDHADKIKVKEFISRVLGKEFVIPLYGIYDEFNQIRFGELPLPCIIKTNHDSGSFTIIRDNVNIDKKKLKNSLDWSLRRNIYWFHREWWYNKINPQILIEKLLTDDMGKIPNDYKLNCFNGKVNFIYIAYDREGLNKRFIFDTNWNELPFSWGSKWLNKSASCDLPAKPVELDSMIQIAEKIAKFYLYVRVDLYVVNGNIYVGEITHTHGGGFDKITPKEWDFKLGNELKVGLEEISKLEKIDE